MSFLFSKFNFYGFFTCMTTINFKANLINRTNIKEKKNNEYSDISVSVVELDRENINDRNAIKKIYKTWDSEYDDSLCYNFLHYFFSEDEHYYALTTQKDNFSNLSANDVLGLLNISDYSENPAQRSINFLQVRPKMDESVEKLYKKRTGPFEFFYNLASAFRVNNVRDDKYKRVGTELLNTMKCLYSDKPIVLDSATNAVEFYKKNGFKVESTVSPYHLIWNA